MMQTILKFLRDEDGPTAVEYAVMLALIIVVCLVAIQSVGTEVSESFNHSQDEINQHFNGIVGN